MTDDAWLPRINLLCQTEGISGSLPNFERNLALRLFLYKSASLVSWRFHNILFKSVVSERLIFFQFLKRIACCSVSSRTSFDSWRRNQNFIPGSGLSFIFRVQWPEASLIIFSFAALLKRCKTKDSRCNLLCKNKLEKKAHNCKKKTD